MQKIALAERRAAEEKGLPQVPGPFSLTEAQIAVHSYNVRLVHTGARITEIMQLRKADLRQEDELYVIRLSPDAGTIKTGHYRDVPLHHQLVELGFPEFVAAVPEGPLFYSGKADEVRLDKAEHQGNRTAAWLRAAKLVPTGVQPNHAWRHQLKTVAREIGISDRVADAICGHAGRTADDNYGDVTVKARARAYVLTAAPVSDADLAAVSNALVGSSLPAWTEQCNAVKRSRTVSRGSAVYRHAPKRRGCARASHVRPAAWSVRRR
ncbi:tyrosine-type recombinase/integrase [Roseivivax sediminis]|uniref:Phage integrase family protein n=1 Tax=Roseivivax sediminis TaxID=936889 RepID=A0A1I1W9Q5_9RHOB|nr:tyrosine-type recombinase/integrase [Roseivivax sediminis]SFD91739.1 Phage integrase family protein [Roseivivax sediminis]